MTEKLTKLVVKKGHDKVYPYNIVDEDETAIARCVTHDVATQLAAVPYMIDALQALLKGSEYKNIMGVVDWHSIKMPDRDALNRARGALMLAGVEV